MVRLQAHSDAGLPGRMRAVLPRVCVCVSSAGHLEVTCSCAGKGFSGDLCCGETVGWVLTGAGPPLHDVKGREGHASPPCRQDTVTPWKAKTGILKPLIYGTKYCPKDQQWNWGHVILVDRQMFKKEDQKWSKHKSHWFYGICSARSSIDITNYTVICIVLQVMPWPRGW